MSVCQEEIAYKCLLDKGFKRKNLGSDKVFFNEFGYEWFILSKKLAKNWFMNWDPSTRKVELLKEDKAGFILIRERMKDEEEVDRFIRLLGKASKPKTQEPVAA